VDRIDLTPPEVLLTGADQATPADPVIVTITLDKPVKITEPGWTLVHQEDEEELEES
jgi:hypothetical protein